MSVHYDSLTEAEAAHWDEYANLRQITDWAGFSDAQEERKLEARNWLVERRKEIWRLAQPESESGDGEGWDHANRRERYETLKDENLNSATVQRQETTLAAGGCTDTEKALIEEREVYWQIDSTTDEQKARKQACTDELVTRRKQVWQMAQQAGGWDLNNRETRYNKLCVATKFGKPYEVWNDAHDQYGKWAGDPQESSRAKAMSHMAKRLGYTESPAGSNCDKRSDGIRTAQLRTAGGGAWLLYQPWCGCWCYYALDAAGVEGIDSSLASVAMIEECAKKGSKCYRGWTTDRSRPQRGDLVVIGGYGVHVEMVRDDVQSDGGVPTYGGNTVRQGGTGSQSNGGGAHARVRYPHEIRGFALVDFP